MTDYPTPQLDALARERNSSHPFVASVAYVAPWPTLNEVALHGLAGDFVRVVKPHSEADPAGLLTQFMVAAGSLFGRGPYFPVEADRHGLNLYAVMVGDTSKARKGTSWGHVKRVMGRVDESWLNRVKSGISSGEGIIFEVRDPVYKLKDGEETLEDVGVTDKRMLLVEPEYASVLKMGSRQGNTVSTVLRDAWDQDVLSPLTKNARIVASNPHISVVGHITRAELVRSLTETEAANGFANRFLWVCVKRSRLLPRGGQLQDSDLEPVIVGLQDAMEFSEGLGEIKRTEEAWQGWERIYGALSEGKPGLLGAVIARAEAQVTRLSTLYAVLDKSSVIRPEHQKAALAVWEYCEASARYIFGDSLGDPVADELLNGLRRSPEGLSRTQIRDFFGRHKRTAEVDRALGVLLRQGLVGFERRETRGRPVEIWYASGDKSDKSDKR